MATARYSPTATQLGNGRVLVVGGEGDNSRASTAELYDAPTGTWLPGGTLNQPRGLHVAVRLADGPAQLEVVYLVLAAVVVLADLNVAQAELHEPLRGAFVVSLGFRAGHGVRIISAGQLLLASD